MPTIPLDFPVQPLKPGQKAKDKATCGNCGLSWDDAIPTTWTPAPSARCPFEYFHEQDKTMPKTKKRKFSSAFTEDGNIRQPFVAKCAKCNETIFFDLDPDGTPGFNGDWGDGHGDYGCAVDNGENSEDGNGHVPTNIRYNRKLYPRPKTS